MGKLAQDMTEEEKTIKRQKAREHYWKNRDHHLAVKKIYYQENKEEIQEYISQWRKNNPDKVSYATRKNKDIEYRNKPGVRDRINARARKNRKTQKSKDWFKTYREQPHIKIKNALHGRVIGALNGKIKAGHLLELCGCNIHFLKKHIESQFIEKMSWENYGAGKGKWHIDHIKPCSWFDMTKSEHQKECFHYSNLRPLWSEDNVRKNNSLDYWLNNVAKPGDVLVESKDSFCLIGWPENMSTEVLLKYGMIDELFKRRELIKIID